MEQVASREKLGFLEPDKIVASLGIHPGDQVADFGAGHGYYAIALARAVGGDGSMYAIDIQKPVLDIVRAKARVEHLLNIQFVWGDLDQPQGSKIHNNSIDLVLIANILFQSDKKEILMGEAYRILKPGGHLALIEWDTTPSLLGPAIEVRIKKELAVSLAQSVRFELDHEFNAGSHHYGLLFVKK